MNKQQLRISVIGLGKLGSPMVAVFAANGYSVIGHDVNSAVVANLAEGKATVVEPGLQALLDRSRQRIRATTDISVAIKETDATFIVVPTPTGHDDKFSNRYVLDAVRSIGAVLRDKRTYHLVVVTSTVMPGSTGGEIQSALEQASGRLVGPDLGLCYNPEFIALGSVIENMRRPDMILIGESDAAAGHLLEQIYKNTTDGNPAVYRMNFVNAELAKISVNTFITMKISFANMIGDMCDSLIGANAEVVNGAVGADSRIGKKYLKSAVGYGGPCFPRDNRAFAALAQSLGARCDLVEATDRINNHQLVRLLRVIAEVASPGQTIAVLGLAYKPSTSVIEGSQGVMLAEKLADAGYAVVVFDPIASSWPHEATRTLVASAMSATAAIAEANVVVIMTPWDEFRELTEGDFGSGGRKRVVVDPWRILSDRAIAGVDHLVIPGIGPHGQADRG